MTSATTAVQEHCAAHATYASPLGVLLLARTGDGLAGAWFDGQKHHPGELPGTPQPDDPLLARAACQLARYFAGEPTHFDVPLDLRGTPFERRVWAALASIERGATKSYAAVASELGMPRALRAVGSAIGRNPVSIIVPCHRVVGSNGALTGYAGGVERKRALLALERADERPAQRSASADLDWLEAAA